MLKENCPLCDTKLKTKRKEWERGYLLELTKICTHCGYMIEYYKGKVNEYEPR